MPWLTLHQCRMLPRSGCLLLFVFILILMFCPSLCLSFKSFWGVWPLTRYPFNYVSDINTKLSMFGLNTSVFRDPRIKYFKKSMARHTPFNITLKAIIDIPMLYDIDQACGHLHMGFLCKAAISLSFSFLRTSNLVPHTISLLTH